MPHVLHTYQACDHESLKAYLAPTGLVSEPRGDLTCGRREGPSATRAEAVHFGLLAG